MSAAVQSSRYKAPKAVAEHCSPCRQLLVLQMQFMQITCHLHLTSLLFCTAADGGGPSSQWDNLDGVKGIYSRLLPDIREVNAMFERRGSERIVRPSPPSLGMQLGITPHNAPELIAYMTGGDATVWEEMTGLDQHGQKLKRQAEREQEHARKLAQQELLNGEGSRRESTDLASDEPSPGVAQEISEAVSMETG